MSETRKPSSYVVPRVDEARIARVWEHIEQRLGASPARTWRWRMPALAAACVAVAALVLWLGPSQLFQTESVWERAAFETASDELAVDLADGSKITLSPKTRVAVVSGEPRSVELALERGKVACNVVPDSKRVFTVVASGVRVRVVGTVFSVDSQREDRGTRVQVQVERGLVEVAAPGAEPVRLGAGQTWSLVTGSSEATTAAPSSTPTTAGPNDGESPDVSDPSLRRNLASDQGEQERASGGADETSARNEKLADAAEGEEKAPSDTDAKTLFEQANAARRRGDTAGAVRAYEALLAGHPGDGRAGLAAFELGRLRMDRLGDLPGAARAFQQAIKSAPGAGFREDALARLVRAYDAMGATAQCERAKQSYLRSFPSGVQRAAIENGCSAK